MRLIAVFFFILAFSGSFAFAEDKDDSASGLPLPRFVSLRSGEVNMRLGPGFRYPIIWIYTRKGLPLEVTAEYDVWRKVLDPEGVEGWISRVELTGKRGAIVTGTQSNLLDKDEDGSPLVAHLEAGAVGQIVSCAKDWCKLSFDGEKGYLRKTDFWGAYPEEVFD